jgi:hypothetical protein
MIKRLLVAVLITIGAVIAAGFLFSLYLELDRKVIEQLSTTGPTSIPGPV